MAKSMQTALPTPLCTFGSWIVFQGLGRNRTEQSRTEQNRTEFFQLGAKSWEDLFLFPHSQSQILNEISD